MKGWHTLIIELNQVCWFNLYISDSPRLLCVCVYVCVFNQICMKKNKKRQQQQKKEVHTSIQEGHRFSASPVFRSGSDNSKRLKAPPTSSACRCQPSGVNTNCSLGPGVDSPLMFRPTTGRSKTCREQWRASFSHPRFTFPRYSATPAHHCQSPSGDKRAQSPFPFLWGLYL